MEKSAPRGPFYRSIEAVRAASDDVWGGSHERVEPQPTTAGPWTSQAQHGGPPAGLLARAVEQLPQAAGGLIGRFTMELWGPVPLTELVVTARVLKPGRSVSLVGAQIIDPSRDRVVATAQAWLFPASTSGPAQQPAPLAHRPADGAAHERPASWSGGYLDAIDWSWITGDIAEPGAGVVWMRPPDLVEGEAISPVQRLLACVDSASGVSAMLDVREWAFLNTDLTVHLVRPPVGDWVCLDAETTLGPGSTGIASADVYDELGLVARSRQALLVARR